MKKFLFAFLAVFFLPLHVHSQAAVTALMLEGLISYLHLDQAAYYAQAAKDAVSQIDHHQGAFYLGDAVIGDKLAMSAIKYFDQRQDFNTDDVQNYLASKFLKTQQAWEDESPSQSLDHQLETAKKTGYVQGVCECVAVIGDDDKILGKKLLLYAVCLLHNWNYILH